MVTRVHYLVAGYESKIVRDGKIVPYKQQPQLVSTLRKLVYFKPMVSVSQCMASSEDVTQLKANLVVN